MSRTKRFLGGLALLALLASGGATSVFAGDGSTAADDGEAQKDQLCSEAIEMDGLLKSDQYQALTGAEKDDFFLRAWEITVKLKDLGYPSDICDREASQEGSTP